MEALRLWGNRPGVPGIGGTAVQVPTFYGHALSITVELKTSADVDAVRQALQKGAGLKVLDAPGERIYPMPMLVNADPTVHVGRIRQVQGEGNWFELFAVIDNAGRGAALNAVDAALALLERGA
jgi:aspartate-semialdehyde dehydrogenase